MTGYEVYTGEVRGVEAAGMIAFAALPFAQGGMGDNAVGLVDDILENLDYIDLTDFRRTHILNRHKAGAGISGKSEFPTSWTDDEIIHNISDVASDPLSVTGIDNQAWNTPYAIGTRNGIEIRVDFYPNYLPNGNPHPRAGMISTAYPLNTPKNP